MSDDVKKAVHDYSLFLSSNGLSLLLPFLELLRDVVLLVSTAAESLKGDETLRIRLFRDRS